MRISLNYSLSAFWICSRTSPWAKPKLCISTSFRLLNSFRMLTEFLRSTIMTPPVKYFLSRMYWKALWSKVDFPTPGGPLKNTRFVLLSHNVLTIFCNQFSLNKSFYIYFSLYFNVYVIPVIHLTCTWSESHYTSPSLLLSIVLHCGCVFCFGSKVNMSDSFFLKLNSTWLLACMNASHTVFWSIRDL